MDIYYFFKCIKEYIYQYIENDYTKIKWKYFTTDFVENLFKAFKKQFKNQLNLDINDAFFII